MFNFGFRIAEFKIAIFKTSFLFKNTALEAIL